MTTYSKLLTYSCYELGHTWHYSCTKSSFDVFVSAFNASLKIYAVVYLLSTLISRKKLTKERAIEIFKNYLQSSFFLSINGSFYVAAFCICRRIFGHINFLSASWLPSFIASYLAIIAERPSRRGLLAIYVSYVATESLWNVLTARGFITPIPKGEVLVFSAVMTLFGYYFKTSTDRKSLINSILKFILGSEEACPKTPDHHSKATEIVTKSAYKQKWKHKDCPHKGSCITSFLKTCVVGWAKGYSFQVGFRVLTSLPKLIKNPYLLLYFLTSKETLGMTHFLSWFSAVFKGTCCAGRWIHNEERPIHGAFAGALAALGMYFSPSTSLTVYAFWKALETLYEKGVESKYLPVIPRGIEILYSFSTAYLFHLAMLEHYNLKPSYWRFLMNLTNGKIADFNKLLLNCYGLNSGKLQHWPKYDINHLSSGFIKRHYDELLKAAV